MLVRMKNAEELEGFRRAGQHAAAILDQLAGLVTCGRRTAEIGEAAAMMCREQGVEPAFLGYNGFPGALCVSVNEEVVHGIPGDRVLQDGDLVKLDIGVSLDGFIGDTARTLRVGGLRGDKSDILMLDCQHALLLGIAAARPGADLGDIGEAISALARHKGWQVITHYGGHGIDRGRLHADPFVDNTRARRLRLRPGMVLAIEPMFVDGPDAVTRVADDGWTVLANGPTAHFEHTIAVAALGEPHILTRKEKA